MYHLGVRRAGKLIAIPKTSKAAFVVKVILLELCISEKSGIGLLWVGSLHTALLIE